MSYTVLARKFRSQTFEEVVGQDSITATLCKAIEQDRVHHGYLFCGTRGVGKTSMARILAKSLNCLANDAPTTKPCCECDSCINIARGEDVDVVEIDAASNTGVDNIRELRNNAIYRPARSRFKIYIIDEVHMLSKGAFNALLKTLEEPPGHVKFIFATTEANKVPATILSRVQRFDFKAIAPAKIAKQLAFICGEEGVKTEEAALKRVARLANGSMRDALSLLDQVLSMASGSVTADIVNEIFPATHDELFAALIDRLVEGDAAGALEKADESLSQGHALDQWCGLLIDQLRDLMILRVCGAETELVDVPAGSREKLVEQSKQMDAGAYVYMITVLEELRRSMKSSGSARALIEAAMVRLAEASNFSSLESLLAFVDGGAPAGQPRPAPAKAPAGAAPMRRPAPTQTPKPPPAKRTPATAKPEGTTPVQVPRPMPRAPQRGRASGAAPAAQPGPTMPRRKATQADLKEAREQPIVKAAIEAFGGTVIDVVRGQPGPSGGGNNDSEPQIDAAADE